MYLLKKKIYPFYNYTWPARSVYKYSRCVYRYLLEYVIWSVLLSQYLSIIWYCYCIITVVNWDDFSHCLKKKRILTSTCMDINANLVRVLISIFCIDQNLIGCLYRTDHRFILYCTYWFYWCRIDARLDKLVVKGIRCHGNRLKVEKLVIIRSFKSNRKLCQDI